LIKNTYTNFRIWNNAVTLICYCFCRSFICNWNMPWRRVFLEMSVAWPVKFPIFYGIWRFITMSTKSHHWTLF